MAAKTPPPWAQAIRARRESLGTSKADRVTQEDVAARTGDMLSQRTVSHIEQGSIELDNLAYGRVVALAKALNWTLPELQAATGLVVDSPSPTPPQPTEPQMPDGLREAVEQYGAQYTDLRDPRWQRYLSRIRWRTGQPTEPGRWVDAYRDLVRNGIEPGEQ